MGGKDRFVIYGWNRDTHKTTPFTGMGGVNSIGLRNATLINNTKYYVKLIQNGVPVKITAGGPCEEMVKAYLDKMEEGFSHSVPHRFRRSFVLNDEGMFE